MKGNPFLSVWTKPKKTVKEVAEDTSIWFALLITGIAGISSGLSNLQGKSVVNDFSTLSLVLLSIPLGMLMGIATAFLTTVSFTLIGKVFGGKSSLKVMFKGMGAMYIPRMIFSILLLIIVLIAGEQFFIASETEISANSDFGLEIIIAILNAITGIFTIIIMSKGVGVLHQFSSWKGFAVVLITGILAFIFTLFVGIGGFMVFG
ncbi:YIP1 family protein [Jeotgalibacillus sp. ET6]|uniref:YIP1 family protein n=1 Tax=Jeotgalibacillus sp. ET6 TaxID=3037260 RepID=UPI0024188DAB|nr:YIP1 family protein [Jeotgalibacillus sp. ET6]MDG5472579.1 YIP1 family protein [Jeotgalibacillus sp. ET6]